MNAFRVSTEDALKEELRDLLDERLMLKNELALAQTKITLLTASNEQLQTKIDQAKVIAPKAFGPYSCEICFSFDNVVLCSQCPHFYCRDHLRPEDGVCASCVRFDLNFRQDMLCNFESQ